MGLVRKVEGDPLFEEGVRIGTFVVVSGPVDHREPIVFEDPAAQNLIEHSEGVGVTRRRR